MTSASVAILAPHVEAQLSARARGVLARPTAHRNASRYRSREDLAAAIRGYGASATEAILDFEEQFGGLELSTTPFSLTLGISLPDPGAVREDDDEDENSEAPDPRALGLLPCGNYRNGAYEPVLFTGIEAERRAAPVFWRKWRGFRRRSSNVMGEVG